ncbi:hypothetical protein BDV98DRAFT_559571 [Pterulicium gracile]|uniref:Uncharacterized protein n=1 Tax=Pterulicium gracile TaxID=1884261 RepID=A0A5C3QXA0_9AGAR|nr:hypothetical protein BDV98DRAFT_559571 [Pterula gracilis]
MANWPELMQAQGHGPVASLPSTSMRLSHLALCVAPVLLAQAQSTNDNDEVLVTSVSSRIVIDGNREQSTILSTIVFTSTRDAQPTGPPNDNNNGNQSASNSGGSSNSARPSNTRPLPTASAVPGGGGPNGAPEVGKDNAGGIYGPPDDHFSSALHPVACVFALGSVMAGALTLLL